jgi:hypothetical protein
LRIPVLMRHVRALPLLLALLCSCTVSGREAYSPLFVYDGTERLVVPILEERYASRDSVAGSRQGAPEASSRHLGRLMEDSSLAADEAAVVLLGYTLGTADNEALMHNLTLRGKRILPYLLGYRDRSLSFPGKSHLDSLKIPADDRREFFDTVIEAIQNGEVIGVD